MEQRYSDQFIDWLVECGYTTCFFLAGGNIMHVLNSARTRLKCIPVIHEVSAGIAAEYFNATIAPSCGKAFALVTAGPGVSNIVTAIAGAFMESRELLVVAGQVKSSDLADSTIRQRGIQEIDACALVGAITKAHIQLKEPITQRELVAIVRQSATDRMGPVFIDFCLDVQASRANPRFNDFVNEVEEAQISPPTTNVDDVSLRLRSAKRPILLIGGGVSRSLARHVLPRLEALQIPTATTWNALDRVPYESPIFMGRPDTWGMRWANVILQQADLIIAVGARLSLQQTGFNWQSFAPCADIIHIDVDEGELNKCHPVKHDRIRASAESFLPSLLDTIHKPLELSDWFSLATRSRTVLPLNDPNNKTAPGYVSPYQFAEQLSNYLTNDDIIVPCSSGGASTVLMQAFKQKLGQLVVNNKALASMGYGLAGAIGACLANPSRRVTLVEGDGGFAQNLQELGTVRAQDLNLKIFIFDNNGYASIRMTQQNYYQGHYVGCDEATGVGLPNLESLAQAYRIPFHTLSAESMFDDPQLHEIMNCDGPNLILVPLDPDQTYFPKITSKITPSGEIESNPIHLMSPDLPFPIRTQIMPHL